MDARFFHLASTNTPNFIKNSLIKLKHNFNILYTELKKIESFNHINYP